MPTESGTFTVVVTAGNGVDPVATQTLTIVVEEAPSPPTTEDTPTTTEDVPPATEPVPSTTEDTPATTADAPSTTVVSGSTTEPAAAPAAPPASGPAALARTGSAVTPLALAGMATLAVGATMLVVARRRSLV